MRLEPPKDLTIPEPDSTITRTLLGLNLRQAAADLFDIPRGRFDTRVYDGYSDVSAELRRLLREKQHGLVFSILRRPTHAVLIRCLQGELWGDGDVQRLDGWLTELTALIALDLARYDQLPADGIQLGRSPRILRSIGLGLELEFEPDLQIGFKSGQLVLVRDGRQQAIGLGELGDSEVPGLQVRRPYHPIVDNVLLATTDNNPLAMSEAHPDKQGNAIDLGSEPVEAWLESLRGGFEIIDTHMPELGQEMRLTMQLWHPVGVDAHSHLSASYAEALGTAYLSLHPDPMTMTEALVHEFSHSKLNALLTLDRIFENAFEPLFESPIRPDPRPLYGILLAVHAFIPVARLYELMTEADHELSQRPRFKERFRGIIEKNHDGITTLENNAETTPIGRSLLDELLKWDRHFASLTV